MSWQDAKRIPRSAPAVLAILLLLGVFAFAGVSHLVNRFNANQRARGFRLYQQGVADINQGNPEAALEKFRAALTMDPANSQYQLSLGRALRDTGRLDEGESYLSALWQRTPQDGTINLALGRLAARRGSVEDAIRYYHNAMYGVWSSDPELNRRKARLELIDFLLQKNAMPQAQAELVALAASLPPDPALHLQTARLFEHAGDLREALAEYQQALHLDHNDAPAISGAGEVAFRAGHYRTAQHYLQQAVAANSHDSSSRQMLETASLVLQTDPFVRYISDAERNRRIGEDFNQAGQRLESCARKDQGTSQPPASQATTANGLAAQPTSSLDDLRKRWLAIRPQLARLRSSAETDLPDAIMDLVFQVEQTTAAQCGEPQNTDLALLLLSRSREAVEQ
jgi:tetratricopeptide (TPR) repeat protein